MRARSLALATLAVALLHGCSLATDFDDFELTRDASIPVDYDAFVSALATKVCLRGRTCEGRSAPALIQQAACGHVASSDSTSLFEHYLARFAPHARENLDVARAEACLAAFPPDTCSTDVLPSECAFLRFGTHEDAADCNVDSDCASGRCVGSPTACGARICAPLGEATESCDASIDCASGLRCSNATCVAPKPAGSACSLDSDCDAALWCDDVDGTGACAARPAVESAACAVHAGTDPCVFGLSCVAGACVRGVAAQSACDATHPCAPGSRCVAAVCRTIGSRGDGCVTRDECAANFDCVSSACVPSPVEGESCDANSPCAVGTCSGTCRIPRTGATCASSTLPFVPLCEERCDATFTPGHCESWKGLGAGCTQDSECESGACVGTDNRVCAACR